MEKISTLVKRFEDDYTNGQTQVSEFVSFNLKETLDKISAYINSKFTSGDTDSLGRQKPFYDIVTAYRNITMRATDVDSKNITVEAKKEADDIPAFLATIHLREWIKSSLFGQFLNDWGKTLATYGSAVVKFVEKDGDLHSEVIPWNRLIVDAVDFDSNPVIEKLYFTPAQLRQNESYDQEMVESLIESAKGTRKNWSGQQKDNKSEYIEVYEVHGNLPLSYLTDKDEDEKVYQQQMHVISFNSTRNKVNNEFTLYSGRESKSPYMITHLIKEDGRTLGIGAVEHLFEAQWMVNHSTKLIKDQLELASKIIFQTSDGNLAGKNALTNIENGEIIVTAQNQGLTQLNNKPDIVAMQSYQQQWESQARQIAGASEAMVGDNPPSGTAWRQVQAMLSESYSLFKYMKQTKSFYVEKMLDVFIAPFIWKKMDTTEEIAATLEANQIKRIDTLFIPGELVKRHNREIIDTVLSGQIAQNPDDVAIEGQIQKQLNEKGNKRYIKPSDISTRTWKNYYKNFKGLFKCDSTNEDTDVQAKMATYDTALRFIIGLQGRQMTPVEEYLFNGLISQTGYLSPVEVSARNSQTPQLPMGQQATPATGGSMPALAMQPK